VQVLLCLSFDTSVQELTLRFGFSLHISARILRIRIKFDEMQGMAS
jgi:hypothetical protein